MARFFGLLIMMLAWNGLPGCAQDPAEPHAGNDTKLDPRSEPTGEPGIAPIPDSTLTFARAAVEVKQIKIGQMPDFEATVEQMNTGERRALWLTLKALHDDGHPSKAVIASFGAPIENTGCSIADCSHSTPYCVIAQWCCAFGEDALFYAYDEDM